MPFTKEEISAIEKLAHNLKIDQNYRNNVVKNCPVCGHNVQDRTISLYKELIGAVYKIYVWCGQHKTHEFDIKDVKDMMGKNEYARFGDMVRFGGLVYKPKENGSSSRKGLFGLNMARCKEFFRGDREIPVYIVINQITGEILESKDVKIGHFPELKTYLDEKGLYDYEKKAN